MKMKKNELWHERHSTSKKKFDTDAFLFPFISTDDGDEFLGELHNLLLSYGEQQITMFWAAQLWYATGRWGLEYMKTL